MSDYKIANQNQTAAGSAIQPSSHHQHHNTQHHNNNNNNNNYQYYPQHGGNQSAISDRGAQVGINNSVQRAGGFHRRQAVNSSNVSALGGKMTENGASAAYHAAAYSSAYKGGPTTHYDHQGQHQQYPTPHQQQQQNQQQSQGNIQHQPRGSQYGFTNAPTPAAMWNTSASSAMHDYHQHHGHMMRHQSQQNMHQMPPYHHKMALIGDNSAENNRYSGWHQPQMGDYQMAPQHRGSLHNLRGNNLPSEHRIIGIRDFNLAPAIGGTNEGPQAIEDFRVADDDSAETHRGGRRKKPNLATSDCIDDTSSNLDQKVALPINCKSKQPLNEEEIDIGIGRITPPEASEDSPIPDDINEFKCLRKLARKRSSPIKRLLKDVDGCLLSFFESIQLTQEQSPAASNQTKQIKTTSSSNAAIPTLLNPQDFKTEHSNYAGNELGPRETSATTLQQDSGKDTYQSLQDRRSESSTRRSPPIKKQIKEQSCKDTVAVKESPQPHQQQHYSLKGENPDSGNVAASLNAKGRRRSSIELICREKLNIKTLQSVQKRVRRALKAIEKAQTKTSNSFANNNSQRRRKSKSESRAAGKVKKQEQPGHNPGDGAQSTETTPKTPKFSEKSRKDRIQGKDQGSNVSDEPSQIMSKKVLQQNQMSGERTTAFTEEELKLNITGGNEPGATAPAQKKSQQQQADNIDMVSSQEDSETSSEEDDSETSSDEEDEHMANGQSQQTRKRGRPKKDQSTRYRKPAYQPSRAVPQTQRPSKTQAAAASTVTNNVTVSKQMVFELPPLDGGKSQTTLKSSGQGLGKKMELMRSLRDIEKKGRIEKMTVQKRGKVIRKPQSAKQPRINKASVAPIQFHCEACNEDFQTGQALGGHMSRVHPGQSNSYARKIQRREERTFDRELLRLAKLEHAKMYGEDTSLDRVKIRRFKRNLRGRILKGEYVEGYMGNVDV